MYTLETCPIGSLEACIHVGYGELEDYIKETLGIDYEIPCYEEASNGATIECDVEPHIDEQDEAKVKEMCESKIMKHWMLNDIMDYMCKWNLLPAGTYMVKVWW